VSGHLFEIDQTDFAVAIWPQIRADEMLIQTSRSHRRHALEMQATLTGGIIGAMIIPRISIFRNRKKSHNFR
jgi:hypothetical protein